MSPTEQKKLGVFLDSRKKKSVQEYLKLGIRASAEDQAEAVEKRRLWAQAQQTNPKFQEEALWVLANTHLLQEALEKTQDELLWLKPSSEGHTDSDSSTDHYQLLGVTQDATFEQIQDAHRLRYRDARQLRNRHEAHQVYSDLDEAWRVLSDPDLREEYDARNTVAPELALRSAPDLSDREALTHSPNLAFTGPSQLEFSLSGKSIQHTLQVERIGSGLVDATIRSDQPWLKVSPERLDPHAASQKLTLTMLPEEVPGKGALGQLVLKNFNGQRLALHIRVRTTPETQVRKGFVWGLLGLSVLAALGWVLLQPLHSGTTEAPVIHLSIEPPNATAWINNKKQAEGWPQRIDGLPADSPFRLRIEAEGHKDHQETLVLKSGQELTKSIRLEPLGALPVNSSEN